MKVVHSPHPVLPAQDRRTFEINKQLLLTEATTIADVLEAIEIDLRGMPVVLQVNGIKVDIDEWDKFHVKANDEIVVRATVQGGGGGSNPLAFILSIALVVMAPYLAGTVLGFSGLMANVVAFGIVMVGNLIINALFPPSLPGPVTSSNKNPSPTYSLTGGSNASRPYDVLPFVVGTHRVFPDYDSKPYTEYYGDDQYLYQTFNFGVVADSMSISDISIGDNPISNFDGVEIEISQGKTGTLTMFPANVDTQSGGDLNDDTGWIQRTTPEGTYAIGVDVEGALFAIDKEGNINALSVTIGAEWRIHPNGAWQPFFGSSNQTTISSASQDPVRKSWKRSVGGGQYDVRVRKLTGDFSSDRKQCHLTCPSIRSYQKDNADYSGQKRMAIKIKASGQLNGVLQTVNAIVSQYMPAWTGTSWQSQNTSNPAWIYYNLAKGIYDPEGNLLVGLGLSDAEIDGDQIKHWGQWCNTHGLNFNFVFDQQLVCGDLLTIPARVGRGTWSWGTGKLGIVFDEESLPVTQMIAMENIVNGSFQIDYVSADLADEIVLSFINPALGWKPDTVRVVVPGVTEPVNPVNVEIPGITSKVQAGQEANLLAARQRYHKRRVTLTMDSEALVSTRGDVITLSHDLTSWGQSSRVASASSTTQITLQTPVTFTAGQTHYCAVRYPNGTIYVRQVVSASGEQTTLTLSSPLPTIINNDVENKPEDYLVQFDIKETPAKRMKIVGIRPVGEFAEQVQLELINDDPDYYSTEGSGYDYIEPGTYNNNIPTVYDLSITEDILNAATKHVRINLSWKLIAAKGARLRVKEYNGSWVNYGEILGTSYSFDYFKATTIVVELTPVALAVTNTPGTTITQEYTIVGVGSLPPGAPIVVPNVSGLELYNGTGPGGAEFSVKDPTFTWRSSSFSGSYELGDEPYGGDSGVIDPYFKDFEIEIWADGTKVFTDHTTNPYYTFWFADNALSPGGPHRDFTIKVYQRNTLNARSEIPAVLKVNNPAPAGVGFTLLAGIQQYWVEMEQSYALDFAGYLVAQGDTADFTPSLTNIVYRGPDMACVINEQTLDEVFVKVAPYDVFSDNPNDLNWTVSSSVIVDPAAQIDEIGFDSIVFKPNDPGANYVSWTAGTAFDQKDGTVWNVSAGNAQWISGVLYVYYVKGASVLATTTNIGEAVNGTILATYRGGTALQFGTNGSAFIDGGKILAQTVGANQLVANTAIITNSAQLANAVITEAHIQDATVSNAKIGDYIQSANWNPSTHQGWKMSKTGGIEGSQITIYDPSGNLCFQSGKITANTIGGVDISTAMVGQSTVSSAIGQALTDSATALAAADGKITTYFQATAPTGDLQAGDLWFDSDDANKLYRWTGSSWLITRDTGIAAAISAAADAEALADQKVRTYIQQTEPTLKDPGDLWYNTANNELRRWGGASWVLWGHPVISGTNISTYMTTAAIDTLYIKGQAVTFSVANVALGGAALPTTVTKLVSATINCTGGKVLLLVTCNMTYTGKDTYSVAIAQARVTRSINGGGESDLRSLHYAGSSFNGVTCGHTYCMGYIDNPGAGNITYNLYMGQTKLYSGNLNYANAYIQLTETKR